MIWGEQNSILLQQPKYKHILLCVGNLFQYVTTLTVKNFFIVSRLCFPSFSLYSGISKPFKCNFIKMLGNKIISKLKAWRNVKIFFLFLLYFFLRDKVKFQAKLLKRISIREICWKLLNSPSPFGKLACCIFSQAHPLSVSLAVETSVHPE